MFGAVVGIGVFALPFIVYQSGPIKGFGALFLAGLLAWGLNLTYAKLVLESGKNFQLGNYGRRYWGNIGFILGSLVLLININGALLAYLIGAGKFLHFLFPVLSSFSWGLIFLAVVFPVIILRLEMIAQINAAIVWLLIFLIIGFLAWGWLEVDLTSLAIGSEGGFFQAFSVFFFSFAGFAVIPELVEALGFRKKPVSRAITIGSLLPGIFYALFIVVGLGVTGTRVSEEFIIGLGKVSLIWSRILLLAATTAIASSFFTFGFALREFWQRDFGFSKILSLALIFLPLLLFYFFANQSFLAVISFTGSASCLLMGGLVLACRLKMDS